jgi:hypothetical protein
MPAPCKIRTIRNRDPDGPDAEMTGEEAVAMYREWRARVIGDHDTRSHDIFDLLAVIREEPGP